MFYIPCLGLHFGNYHKNRVTPPSNYKLIFNDDFKCFDDKKWALPEQWEDFQPFNIKQHWQTDMNDGLVVCGADGLTLKIKNKPKTYNIKDFDWNRDEIKNALNITNNDYEWTIPTECGKIKSKKCFLYGWFEANIKLPKGYGYWPAFWLSGAHSWGPEIDIFEGYTINGENYDKIINCGSLSYKKDFWRIESNIHYGDSTITNSIDSMNDTKAKEHYTKNANERYVQYVCHWTNDFIKIYYDGQLVRCCDNKDIMKWFNNTYNPTDYEKRHNGNRYNAEMCILLNHGIDNEIKGLPQCDNSHNHMYIKDIKVYQQIFRSASRF